MIQNSKWVYFNFIEKIIQFHITFIYNLSLNSIYNLFKIGFKIEFCCKMQINSLIGLWIQPIWAPNADPRLIRGLVGCQMRTNLIHNWTAQMQINLFFVRIKLAIDPTQIRPDQHLSSNCAPITKITVIFDLDLRLSWS